MPQPLPLQYHYIVLDFPDGWGGLNSDWPPDLLHPNQLSAAWNVYHKGPELQKRGGEFREVFVSAGASIVAGFDAQYSTGPKNIVQTGDGRLWQFSASMTSATAMGTSAFGTTAVFAQLGDVVAIATQGGQMLGTSGSDGVFALGDATTPKAFFVISYKNRFFADGGSVSGDAIFWSAVGATTGLPTVMDWTTAGNAGFLVFGQGESGRLIGIATGRNQWYAFKQRLTYMVTGDTPSQFVVVKVDGEAGMHHRTVAHVGRGLIGANEDGAYELVDSKYEPLFPNRIRTFWRDSVKLTAISAFQGAWIASRDQYRLAYQTSAGVFGILAGVLEPAREIAWYRHSNPAQALWSRLVPVSAFYDFYRGGNADGYVYHLDQGTADASAAIVASAETAIFNHYLLHRSPFHIVPNQAYMDKVFNRAWVFCRTGTAGTAVSADVFIHGEDGKKTPVGFNRRVGLDTSAGDVKRYTLNLDSFTGWGASVRYTFDALSAGSVHKTIIEYADGRVGTGAPV